MSHSLYFFRFSFFLSLSLSPWIPLTLSLSIFLPSQPPLDPFHATHSRSASALSSNAHVQVYVSEYYSGITEQLKLELASRRIRQVVDFTRTNDEMKAEYDSGARALQSRLTAARTLLGGMPAQKDDTMAGAKALLARFNEFRSTEKRALYSDHIKLEALFTNLATRLADNARPPYEPTDASLAVSVRARQLADLQQQEKEVGLALHAELSRQHRLLQQDQEHQSR